MSFEAAVEYVSQQKFDASNEDMLIFYKYYKQATLGDCNTPSPGIFDVKMSAKWKAWNSIKGLSKEEAKQNYIQHLNKLRPDWIN